MKTSGTLKQIRRQQRRETMQRLDDAVKRKDPRAIILESLKLHVLKP